MTASWVVPLAGIPTQISVLCLRLCLQLVTAFFVPSANSSFDALGVAPLPKRKTAEAD